MLLPCLQKPRGFKTFIRFHPSPFVSSQDEIGSSGRKCTSLLFHVHSQNRMLQAYPPETLSKSGSRFVATAASEACNLNFVSATVGEKREREREGRTSAATATTLPFLPFNSLPSRENPTKARDFSTERETKRFFEACGRVRAALPSTGSCRAKKFILSSVTEVNTSAALG